MSADSRAVVAGAVVVRSRRLRQVSLVVAPLVFVGYLAWAVTLSGTTANGGQLMTEDRWAMAALGPIVGALALLPLRVKVEADADRVRVRSLVRDITLPWSAVQSIRYNGTTPWASLILTSSEPVPMLALLIFDGQRAVDNIRLLRALHDAAEARDRGLPAA